MKVTVEIVYELQDDPIIPSKDYIADYIMDSLPLIIWSADNEVIYEHTSSTVVKIEEIDS